MAYRNKTYVCFDADNDMQYYKMLKMWNKNGKINFSFFDAHDLNTLWGKSTEETIKSKLRERLKNTKVMIVLIGEHTKYLHKFVGWEIEYAIKNNIPIIAYSCSKP